MKKLFAISILLLFIGCASNTVKTEPLEPVEPEEHVEQTEPKEPVEPKEPSEGTMPEMPVMPTIPGVQIPEMTQIPDKTESQKGKDISIHQIVKTACGQCQFGMTEKAGCDLAVRIDGKSYFVDGTNIHEHGDAHADDGFCEVIRSASVEGKIIEGRFKSESFTLIK